MSKYLVVLGALAAICGSVSQTASARTRVVQGPAGTSSEVSFTGVDGLVLKGTLLVPSGKGPFPALLLLAGSGPTDRDGSQPGLPANILKDIAEKLATKGVATLRYDKRAVAATYGASFPKTIEGLNDYCRWECFVGDAEAGFAFLKSQPSVNPSQVGVLGHSEGGIIALAMSKVAKPAALVLVSTPARDLGDVVIDQVEHGFSAQFTPPDKLKSLSDATERIVATIRQTKTVPGDVPPELRGLFPSYLSKYLYSVFTYEPTTDAAVFTGPALVVQGEKDIQVSPSKDGPVLFASFPKGKAEYYVAAGCSHCLKHPTGPQDPGLVGVTDEHALDKISEWAGANLK